MNRAQLVEQFRISTQQASADIAAYSARAPQNLEYDRNQKTYRATTTFSPAIASGDARALLDPLVASSPASVPFDKLEEPLHDVVRVPSRPISTPTLRNILFAMREGDELKVMYQSMRRPSASSRWIAPHAIAFDGLRWHVRAWCHENSEYRDFVISRIQRVEDRRKSTVDPSNDGAWNTYLDVVIRPRAELSASQKAAIETDFGMVDGELRINCRRALVFYLLRQLQLTCATPPSVLTQPLELKNPEEFVEIIAAGHKSLTTDANPLVGKLGESP